MHDMVCTYHQRKRSHAPCITAFGSGSFFHETTTTTFCIGMVWMMTGKATYRQNDLNSDGANG